MNRKKNKSKTINTLKNFGSNTSTDNKSIISNVLNKHFTSIGTKLAAKLPNLEKDFTQFLYQNKSPPSFFLFQPITPDEVKLEIMSMTVNKSHEFYSFSDLHFKVIACDNITFVRIFYPIFSAGLWSPGYTHPNLKWQE